MYGRHRQKQPAPQHLFRSHILLTFTAVVTALVMISAFVSGHKGIFFHPWSHVVGVREPAVRSEIVGGSLYPHFASLFVFVFANGSTPYMRIMTYPVVVEEKLPTLIGSSFGKPRFPSLERTILKRPSRICKGDFLANELTPSEGTTSKSFKPAMGEKFSSYVCTEK